jgi:outer membrane protein OmpA-like peptidoglycan-associated protein
MRIKSKHRSLVFAGALLLAAGIASAQEYPKFEIAPGFNYQHDAPLFGTSRTSECAGGGLTFAYNITHLFSLVADLSGCETFGFNDPFGLGTTKLHGDAFTYVFGPRFTFRRGSRFQPFLDVNVGGEEVGVHCNNGNLGDACGSITPGVGISQPIVGAPPPVVIVPKNPYATGVTQNSFAATGGVGIDIRASHHISIRLIQADYLYTRFGNSCPFAICSHNSEQGSFRLQSGLVFSFGGGPHAILPPTPRTKSCPGGTSVPIDQDCPKQDISLGIQANPAAVCPGAVSKVTAAANLPQGATIEWTVNGQPVSGAGTPEFTFTGRDAGSYKVAMKVSAAGYNDASAETTVNVRSYVAPSGSLRVSPSDIWVGDRSTLSASFTPGQCGGALSPVTYSASEGSVSGNQFDSTGVRFDPANTSEQQKTIMITARVSDERGSVSAEAPVVVKQKGAVVSKRFPDIVFPKGSARVNNCGKRVLLEELKSSLDADPNGHVVFVGHTSADERGSADLGLRRALNAAAVISAGAQVCLGFSAANIAVGNAGTSDNNVDFQPYFCESSTGEIQGNFVQQADSEAKNRRVEVWFVPSGGVAPPSAQGSKSAVELNVKTLGCPR